MARTQLERTRGVTLLSRPSQFLRDHGEELLYVVAGVSYVTLGVFVKQALAWWAYGAIFLLFVVWVIPSVIGRLLRRR
jgi:hypothetical protein